MNNEEYIRQNDHRTVVSDFLNYLNNNTSDFILKDGTALLMCYELDRFSEDINLDGKCRSISRYINDYCNSRNFGMRAAENTDIVQKFMINYGDEYKSLNIEVSFRRKFISENTFKKINGILVYDINTLCLMKLSAYQTGDKITDLYDLTFICSRYWDKLSESTVDIIRNAIGYKGIEQLDYIIKTQSDKLIDNDKLANDFLIMYDKLGLRYTQEERYILNNGIHAN